MAAYPLRGYVSTLHQLAFWQSDFTRLSTLFVFRKAGKLTTNGSAKNVNGYANYKNFHF